MSYASGVSAGTWSWRDVPVLEAVLSLGRRDEIATPAAIAAEAILHYDDVSNSIAALVDAGYLDILGVASEELADTTIVTPSAALRGLLQPARRPRRADTLR